MSPSHLSETTGFEKFRKRCVLFLLGIAIWAVPAVVEASHYRGGAASYTIGSNGIVTLTVYSAWRSDSVGATSFVMRAGSGNGGVSLGAMTRVEDSVYATGNEYGGTGYLVRKEVYTFNLTGQPAGHYNAWWSSCCWVSGIHNMPESTMSLEVTIAYTPGQASAGPTMIPATIDIIARGSTYTQNLNTTDPDGTPVVVTNLVGNTSPHFAPSSAIPGLSVGTVGGVTIPASSTATLALGRWSYKVKATDASGGTAIRDVLVVVQEAMGNSAPVLAPIGPKNVAINNPLSFAVSANDPDAGDQITVRAQLIPPGATFPQETGSAAGVSSNFTWTPNPGQEGVYLVNFEAFDDATTVLIDSELVQITVSGANTPPALSPIGNRTVANGGTMSFQISASDADGDSITYSAFNAPAGFSIDPISGAVSWTPGASQYDSSFVGVTIRATDNGVPNLFSEETITLTVGAGNQPPVFISTNSHTLVAGQPYSIPVTAEDPNATQSISIFPTGSLPPGASFASVLGPASGVSGVFEWTPLVASIGLNSVTFRAQDNGVPSLTTDVTYTFDVIQIPPPTISATHLHHKTATTAHVEAHVNPNGAQTNVVFEISTDPGMAGAATSPPQDAGGGILEDDVAYLFTGLSPGTTYYVRASATNLSGTTVGSIISFTTDSVNADLSALTLSSGTLSPTFASGTTAYTASVANGTSSITVTPTRAEANAIIEARVNGGAYAAVPSGSPSGALALNVGANTIDLRVTAQAGNTKTYTITVTRRSAPTVVSPTSTSITATGATLGGNVTDDGAAIITERGVVYSVTATNANPLIGGSGVTKVTTTGTTGVFTTPVTGLTQGTGYSFKAYATNSEGTSYTSVASFTTQSTNADLSALTLSSGTLSPTFASGTTDYTTSIANATTSITVTPTRAQANATIEARVNGGSYAPVPSGSPSGSFVLNVGSNTIDLRVTAQAGNTKTYTITVTRDKASQTITGFANPGPRLANTTVNLSASGGGSGNPVIFTAEGPASIDGSNVLSFTGTGSVTVRANQAGNDLYHAAPEVAHTFTVTAAPATVTLDHLTQTYDGTPKAATATTDPTGLSLSIVHDPALPVNAGEYAVTATVTDPRYSGSVGGTLVIEKAGQLISFAKPGNQVATATVPLSVTGGASGNAVVFTFEGPAQIDGSNLMTFTGPGSVTVRANQAGNANYEAAPEVVHSFEVTAVEATLALSRLHQVADGTPRTVVVTTDPADLEIEVTYEGETDPPTVPGSYAVVASSADARYEGNATGTLVVDDPARSIVVPGGTLPALSALGELAVPTFRLGAYEVTGIQWATVVAWAEANAGYNFGGAGSAASGDRPVTGVSWSDAAKWCNARTEWENAVFGRSLAPAYRIGGAVYKTGTPASPADLECDFGTSGHRLPTAAEWEYAARGGAVGTSSAYPGGNALDDLGWYVGNSNGGVQPAGGKNANGLDLYDLAGNAAEWTWDGPSGNPAQRYLRGGAWSSAANACELTALTGESAALGLDRSGFRIASSVSLALAAALDHPDLLWESGGDEPWFAQTGTTHDGVDAAESETLAPGQSTWLETVVIGPGNLRFRWRSAAPEGHDLLRLEADGEELASLSGATGWSEVHLETPEGPTVLRWTFARGGDSPEGPSRAWVDEVEHTLAEVPEVSTAPVEAISTGGAESGGEVLGERGRAVTGRGVVWSISPDPELGSADSVESGAGLGAFASVLDGLEQGTTYYLRAYAVNEIGIGYGETLYFTTDTDAPAPQDIPSYDRSMLPGDRHVFHFTVGSPRHVAIGSGRGAPITASLYDAAGNLLAEGDGDFLFRLLLLAGNYRLEISGTAPDGLAAPFSLYFDGRHEALARPDLAVGPTANSLIGRGVFGEATLQEYTQRTNRGRQIKGFATVANRGTLPDRASLSASRENRFFRVRYEGLSGNLTGALLRGNHLTPVLVEGNAPAWIRCIATPKVKTLAGGKSARGRRQIRIQFRASSVFDPRIRDTARLRIVAQSVIPASQSGPIPPRGQVLQR